jgi:hypothetical protein
VVEGATISTLGPGVLGAGSEDGGKAGNGVGCTGRLSAANARGAEARGDGAVGGDVGVTGFLVTGGNSSEPSAPSTSLINTRLLVITGAGDADSFADDFETTTKSSSGEGFFGATGFGGVVDVAGFLISVFLAGTFTGDGLD